LADFGIIGCGSWSTALATVLQTNTHKITMWHRDPEFVDNISSTRVNEKYLPGAKLTEKVTFTNDLDFCVHKKDAILMGIPSHSTRDILSRLPNIAPDTKIISVAKGIENDTLLRVSQILSEKFASKDISVLSGPSHAEEVSRGVPTAVVCASQDENTSAWVQEAFMAPAFRVYKHSDVIGVEIGGALKNVVAIAAGIIDGVGAGDNTKAALITRALAEITRLGTKLGADSLTFAGLSGMGDLIVTCMSKYSRNRHLGEQIGRGKTLDEALAGMVMVAEGVRTTRSAFQLAHKNGVEVPITDQAYQVLFENKDPRKGVFDLMTRAAKVEDWG